MDNSNFSFCAADALGKVRTMMMLGPSILLLLSTVDFRSTTWSPLPVSGSTPGRRKTAGRARKLCDLPIGPDVRLVVVVAASTTMLFLTKSSEVSEADLGIPVSLVRLSILKKIFVRPNKAIKNKWFYSSMVSSLGSSRTVSLILVDVGGEFGPANRLGVRLLFGLTAILCLAAA